MKLTEEQIRQIASELETQFSQIYGEKRCIYNGQSMTPILKEGDFVSLIIRKPFKFVLGDLVVYQSLDKFIVHRFLYIYRTKETTFVVTKADNWPYVDPLVPVDQIVGKVIRIARSEGEVDLKGYLFKILSFVLGTVSLLEVIFLRFVQRIGGANHINSKLTPASIFIPRQIVMKMAASIIGNRIRK